MDDIQFTHYKHGMDSTQLISNFSQKLIVLLSFFILSLDGALIHSNEIYSYNEKRDQTWKEYW